MDISFFLIFIFFIGILILLLKFKIKLKSNKGNYKYRKKRNLLSNAELSFYKCLEMIKEDSDQIFCKVRVSDVLSCIEKDRKNWRIGLSKINQKHFDYVIVNKNNYNIKYAIELDDASHNSAKRKKRDQFLNEACKTAELKLIRIKAKAKYELNQLKSEINQEDTQNAIR